MQENLKASPPQHDQWVEEVLKLYDDVRAHREPYEIDVLGMTIQVNPDVFSPKYFADSAWFAAILPEIVGTGRLLEVGCGTGIVGLACAKSGAEVDFSDINRSACECTESNAQRHGLKVRVFEGDVFDAVPAGELYDFIFWNHPFNKTGLDNPDILLQAGFDPQYRGLSKYVLGASTRLKDPQKGLLIGTGNQADITSMEEIVRSAQLRLELLKKEVMPLGPGAEAPNDFRVYGCFV